MPTNGKPQAKERNDAPLFRSFPLMGRIWHLDLLSVQNTSLCIWSLSIDPSAKESEKTWFRPSIPGRLVISPQKRQNLHGMMNQINPERYSIRKKLSKSTDPYLRETLQNPSRFESNGHERRVKSTHASNFVQQLEDIFVQIRVFHSWDQISRILFSC